jgi:LPXTG-site transpeptidase (sortase) family protein
MKHKSVITILAIFSVYILTQIFGVHHVAFVYSLKDTTSTNSLQNKLVAEVSAEMSELPATSVNADNGFRLEIPKIGINRKVVENVDPADEAVYGQVIAQDIAHGKYTKLPDEAQQQGNVYLFAHRDGYANGNSIGFFKRLNELNLGDKAFVYYAQKKYTYELVKSFIVTPQDTWVYTGRSSFPALTLQTCEKGEELRLITQFKLIEVTNL